MDFLGFGIYLAVAVIAFVLVAFLVIAINRSMRQQPRRRHRGQGQNKKPQDNLEMNPALAEASQTDEILESEEETVEELREDADEEEEEDLIADTVSEQDSVPDLNLEDDDADPIASAAPVAPVTENAKEQDNDLLADVSADLVEAVNEDDSLVADEDSEVTEIVANLSIDTQTEVEDEDAPPPDEPASSPLNIVKVDASDESNENARKPKKDDDIMDLFSVDEEEDSKMADLAKTLEDVDTTSLEDLAKELSLLVSGNMSAEDITGGENHENHD